MRQFTKKAAEQHKPVLVDKIVVHEPDKSSGHRTQAIGIHYRFNVTVATAVADSMKYDKRERLRNRIGYATLSSNLKYFYIGAFLKLFRTFFLVFKLCISLGDRIRRLFIILCLIIEAEIIGINIEYKLTVFVEAL